MYISKVCGENTYLLTGLKRRYHSDQLEHVKRAKAISHETPNLKSEYNVCQNVTQSGNKIVLLKAQEPVQEIKLESKFSVVGNKGPVIENELLNKNVVLQVGDEVIYSVANRNTSKLAKRYGPAIITQVCHDYIYYLGWSKKKIPFESIGKGQYISTYVILITTCSVCIQL